MENYLNSTDDQLIKNLDYSLPSSTNYIIDRRSVLFQPLGGSEYSHRSNRIIKFRLTGSDSAWLDPATVRIQYKLINDSGNAIKLLTPALPTNFFRRMRILGANQQIEDLEHYNRLCVMMNVLKPHDVRLSESIEHFGTNDVIGTKPSNQAADPLPYPNAESVDFNALNYNITIPDGDERTVLFQPLCGLFSQSNYIPLRYLPLEIELELCNSVDEPLVGAGSYKLTEVMLHCDLLTLDSSIDNEFTDHILSGKPLSLHLNSFYHTYSVLQNTSNPVLSFNRAHTRIKRCYVSFFKRLKKVNVGGTALTGDDVDAANNKFKEMNLFWHPQLLSIDDSKDSTNLALNNYNTYEVNSKCEFETQCQLGSKNVPEQFMRHSTTQYYFLKKSLNAHHPSSTYSLGITPHEYRTHKHIQVFDFQKSGAFGSGVSTRQGDLITIKINKLISKVGDVEQKPHGYADAMFMVLEYDKIVDISDSGINVMD